MGMVASCTGDCASYVNSASRTHFCHVYGATVMNHSMYTSNGYEPCVNGLLSRIADHSMPHAVFYWDASGKIMAYRDGADQGEYKRPISQGYPRPIHMCNIVWNTVSFGKYSFSTSPKYHRVRYDGAKRACSLLGRRLLNEGDISAAELPSLWPTIFARLTAGTPGSDYPYWLEGGRRMLTPSKLMKKWNVYYAYYQILCFQLCDHGKRVDGKCVCDTNWAGEGCDKDVRLEEIRTCPTAFGLTTSFILSDAPQYYTNRGTGRYNATSYQGAKDLCKDRGFFNYDFADGKVDGCSGAIFTKTRRMHNNVISGFWSDTNQLYFHSRGVMAKPGPSKIYYVACSNVWFTDTSTPDSVGRYSLAVLADASVTYEFAREACTFINHSLLTPQEAHDALDILTPLVDTYQEYFLAAHDNLPPFILEGGTVAFKLHHQQPHFFATDRHQPHLVLCGRANWSAMRTKKF
eukprot:scpid77789/ scgid5364/ 